jgi:hypothetical protein
MHNNTWRTHSCVPRRDSSRRKAWPARYALVTLALLLTACASLPRELRRQISDADSRLLQAQSQFRKAADEIKADLNHSPDLFKAVAADWNNRLNTAKSKLDAAETDRRELSRLDKSGDKNGIPRVRQLLTDEDRLRQTALDEANAVSAQANRWLDFQRNLPHYMAKMQQQHDSVHGADFTAVTRAVEKAEQDWPGKRADLDRRLETLRSAPDRAEQEWKATEAEREVAQSGKASGAQVATLIQAEDVIETSANLPAEEQQLEGLCGQLYYAWDKVLDDLDVREAGASSVYREKVKTVRTHFAESGDHAPQTSTDVRWVDVSPSAYQSVENDLGMAISHKDAGLYDSEAANTAQPAGFAYIAPPNVGSNQYGYWTHNESGSFWTFLPQYLIMRQLFWGNSYRPIVVNEYNTYYNYARTGRTYYGESSPAAPPKYGSHGTFTQQNYGSSRYVQSGGFKNSSFASRQSPQASPSTGAPPAPRMGNAPSDDSQGKRFGRPAGATPAGKRFGGGGNSPPPSGKRFGGGARRR